MIDQDALREEVKRIRDYAAAPIHGKPDQRWMALEDRLPRLVAWLSNLVDDMDEDERPTPTPRAG